MNITVLYFASLREALGHARETLSVPAGVTTVGGLRTHLAARGDAWSRLSPGTNVRAAVNQAMVKDEACFGAGDEVAFFPPVTGG